MTAPRPPRPAHPQLHTALVGRGYGGGRQAHFAGRADTQCSGPFAEALPQASEGRRGFLSPELRGIQQLGFALADEQDAGLRFIRRVLQNRRLEPEAGHYPSC
jgi:hypothetical protein